MFVRGLINCGGVEWLLVISDSWWSQIHVLMFSDAAKQVLFVDKVMKSHRCTEPVVHNHHHVLISRKCDCMKNIQRQKR